MLSRWSGLGRCSILEDSYPGARHLEVEDTGSGHPVLLLHGWPDAASLNLYRAILPHGAPGRPRGGHGRRRVGPIAT